MKAALIVLMLIALSSRTAHSGANAGGRIWVSWDRGGLVTDLNVVQFDHRDVYVQIDGAPDIAALGYNLMFYVDGDSLMSLQAAVPDSQVGWAEPLDGNAVFVGDSTYNWAVHFPVGHERTKIRYVLDSPLEADTLKGSVWVQDVIVQDSHGFIDTLAVMSQARMTGVDVECPRSSDQRS